MTSQTSKMNRRVQNKLPHEECRSRGCDSIQYTRIAPTFRKNLLHSLPMCGSVSGPTFRLKLPLTLDNLILPEHTASYPRQQQSSKFAWVSSTSSLTFTHYSCYRKRFTTEPSDTCTSVAF
jgi:hypothetical protein